MSCEVCALLTRGRAVALTAVLLLRVGAVLAGLLLDVLKDKPADPVDFMLAKLKEIVDSSKSAGV